MGTQYSSSYYKSHYRYNGSSWVSYSTLPYNFYSGSAIVYDGKIHIMGTSSSSSYYKYHYYYNNSSWTSFSTLPYNFYSGDVLLHKNQIHILGSNDSSHYTKHYKLNSGTLLSGYVKSNTQIYQPNGHAYSNNLTTIDSNMFEVTEDGLVEILLEE